MSRYVQIELPALSIDRIREALDALAVAYESGGRRRLMLAGSLECAGEPVDVRLPPGTCDAVEDFGFVEAERGVQLVCGELDRELLEKALLGPLRQQAAKSAVAAAAAEAGLEVETVSLEADGAQRLVLKRR